MNLVSTFKNNIFLLMFCMVSVAYGYGIAYNLNSIIYFFKPFIVLSIALHYIVNTKWLNKRFLTALIFALLGDVLFNITTPQFFIFAMSSFLIFILLLMTIAAEKSGEINFKPLLLATIPFVLILTYVLKKYLNDVGSISILLAVFGVIVVVLSAFSTHAYYKKRDITTLYFFLGTLAFILASISKGLKQFALVSDVNIKLMNTLCYVISLFLFSRAMIVDEKVSTQTEKPTLNAIHL